LRPSTRTLIGVAVVAAALATLIQISDGTRKPRGEAATVADRRLRLVVRMLVGI